MVVLHGAIVTEVVIKGMIVIDVIEIRGVEGGLEANRLLGVIYLLG